MKWRLLSAEVAATVFLNFNQVLAEGLKKIEDLATN